MGRSIPPSQKKLAVSLADIICAYYWRAQETGDHRSDGACRSCRRLVGDDVHRMLGQLLAAAVEIGRAADPPVLSSEATMEEVAERCATICTQHHERVVQSDPRTFETDPDATTQKRGTAATTEHMDVVFALTEYPDGPPWIMLEPRRESLPVLRAGDAFLALTFHDHVTFEEAGRLVAEMQTMLSGVSCTKSLT